MSEKNQYTQQEMKALFFPLLKEKGQLHQKSKNIFARKGEKGECIVTKTSDGKETENSVKDDSSFVVKNQTDAGEEYIVTQQKFQEKYTLIGEGKGNYQEYQSKGKVQAIKLTRKLWNELKLSDKQFYFEPPWKGSMVAKLYDYIVCPPDFSEIYRIARKEFWETYKKIKKMD